MTRAGLAAACGAAALAAATPVAASEAQFELLAREAALAAARADVAPSDAALLLGGALAATRSEALPALERQFLYIEAMLAHLAVGASPVFASTYGAAPEIKQESPSPIAPQLAVASAALRDAAFDRWRASAANSAEPRRDWLSGAGYFAHLALRALAAAPRVDAAAELDAMVDLGVIQHESGRDDSLTQSVAAFARRRDEAKAIAAAEAAFAADAAGLGSGDSPPSGYFAATEIEALAPVALAAVGAAAAQQAIAAKDAAAARRGLDALAGAVAEIDSASAYLAAGWPCSPGLVEGRLWRARQAALGAQYQSLVGGADVGELQADADREYRAALTIALHAEGGDGADFQTARDSYLGFLRSAGRDAAAAQVVLATAAATSPGDAVPAAWGDAVACR